MDLWKHIFTVFSPDRCCRHGISFYLDSANSFCICHIVIAIFRDLLGVVVPKLKSCRTTSQELKISDESCCPNFKSRQLALSLFQQVWNECPSKDIMFFCDLSSFSLISCLSFLCFCSFFRSQPSLNTVGWSKKGMRHLIGDHYSP